MIITVIENDYVCLFCSSNVVNIMELDATIIQVRGLLAMKPGSFPPFST